MALIEPHETEPPRFQLGLSWLPGWTASYFVALGAAGFFLVASLISQNAVTLDPMISGWIALSFAVLGALAAVLLVLSGGVLSALPFFLAGTALFFGLGTFVAVIEPAANNHFTPDQQAVMLPRVNTINATAIFLAVLVAGLFCWRLPEGAAEDEGTEDAKALIFPAVPVAIWLALPLHGVEWLLFPAVEDDMLRGFFSTIGLAPLFAIFLGGMFWQDLRWVERAGLIVLFGLYFTEGLLSFAKLTTIMPVMALGLGLWQGGRHRVWASTLVLAAIAFYFAVLSSLVVFGRSHTAYDPLYNTLPQRAHILGEVVGALDDMARETEHSSAISRFSPTQFSAFFIASHDDGFAGDTMRNAMVVLVPRFLWTDKPIIAPGREIDGAWRGTEILSSLAIGFPSEAYWNLGWPGVIGVGCYIGLMLGWFTRKWLLFRAGGVRHLGILVTGALVVKSALWVESSIVASYIGGWIKLALIILVIDMAVRAAIGMRRRREETDASMVPPAVPIRVLPAE